MGEPMVLGKMLQKTTQKGEAVGARRGVMNFRWHAQKQPDNQCCWLLAGLEHLALNPYVETRGRKKIIMSKPKRDRRLAILRKHARAKSELQQLILIGRLGQRDVDRVIVLGGQLEEMKDEMEDIGGVPKSWG